MALSVSSAAVELVPVSGWDGDESGDVECDGMVERGVVCGGLHGVAEDGGECEHELDD